MRPCVVFPLLCLLFGRRVFRVISPVWFNMFGFQIVVVSWQFGLNAGID